MAEYWKNLSKEDSERYRGKFVAVLEEEPFWRVYQAADSETEVKEKLDKKADAYLFFLIPSDI